MPRGDDSPEGLARRGVSRLVRMIQAREPEVRGAARGAGREGADAQDDARVMRAPARVPIGPGVGALDDLADLGDQLLGGAAGGQQDAVAPL